MFRVNNKDTIVNFERVSIVNFEQVNAHWVYENVDFYRSCSYLDLIIVVIVGKCLRFGSGKWF